MVSCVSDRWRYLGRQHVNQSRHHHVYHRETSHDRYLWTLVVRHHLMEAAMPVVELAKPLLIERAVDRQPLTVLRVVADALSPRSPCQPIGGNRLMMIYLHSTVVYMSVAPVWPRTLSLVFVIQVMAHIVVYYSILRRVELLRLSSPSSRFLCNHVRARA